MVSLVRCRSIATCASWLNYIHSCPSDLQRHCAWISAVMFHSSRRHDVKTAVAVLCLPSSGNTAGSSQVYTVFPVSGANTQRATTFHPTSLLRRHSRCSDSFSSVAVGPFLERAKRCSISSTTRRNPAGTGGKCPRARSRPRLSWLGRLVVAYVELMCSMAGVVRPAGAPGAAVLRSQSSSSSRSITRLLTLAASLHAVAAPRHYNTHARNESVPRKL